MSKEAVFTMKLEPELRAEFMAEAEASHRQIQQKTAGKAETEDLRTPLYA